MLRSELFDPLFWQLDGEPALGARKLFGKVDGGEVSLSMG